MKKRMLVLAMLCCMVMARPAHAGQENILLSIPQLYQTDYTQTLCVYRGEEKSVATSGCAMVCASMVIAYFYPEAEQTPETLFSWAVEEGLYYGNGFSSKNIMKVLVENGVTCEWKKLGKKGIRKALSEGKPIIALMGEGYFTNSGHYILLRGIDENNKVSVTDPDSPKRSKEQHRVAEIIVQSKGSLPFIVCSVDNSESGSE